MFRYILKFKNGYYTEYAFDLYLRVERFLFMAILCQWNWFRKPGITSMFCVVVLSHLSWDPLNVGWYLLQILNKGCIHIQ